MSQVSTKVGNVVIPSTPTCTVCQSPMVLRTARHGRNAGSQFYGCKGYPNCKNTMPYVPAPSTSSVPAQPVRATEVKPPPPPPPPPVSKFDEVIATRKKHIKNNLF